MTFEIVKLTEHMGESHWVLFTHGNFAQPVALIRETEARRIAETILGLDLCKEPLGVSIKRYRKQNKISQMKFSCMAGVSRNYIGLLERGEADNVSVAVQARIINAMSRNE